MTNEIKFSRYVDTNEYVEEIDLNDFIKCKIYKNFFLFKNSIFLFFV
jgi:hypothetical protein